MGQFSMRTMIEATIVIALIFISTIIVGPELGFMAAIIWVVSAFSICLICIIFAKGNLRVFAIGAFPALAIGTYTICFLEFDSNYGGQTILLETIYGSMTEDFFQTGSVSEFASIALLIGTFLPSLLNGFVALYVFHRFLTSRAQLQASESNLSS